MNRNETFYSNWRRVLLSYLPIILSTLFSLVLVFLRSGYSNTIIYYFLVWNLFLAWIPLSISFLLNCFKKQFIKSHWLKLIFLPLWLLFFPNSLYLVTDFLHLTPKPPVPLWFDMLLLLSFSWAGLLVGFVSLKSIQKLLSACYGKTWAWICTFLILFLSSFGIYLGRFLRWNSWDIFFNPVGVLADVVPRVFMPLQYPSSLAVTVLFFGFFLVAYLAFYFRTVSAVSDENG